MPPLSDLVYGSLREFGPAATPEDLPLFLGSPQFREGTTGEGGAEGALGSAPRIFIGGPR